jgi:hypothetical protein
VSEEDGELPVVTVIDLKKSAAEEEARELAAQEESAAGEDSAESHNDSGKSESEDND